MLNVGTVCGVGGVNVEYVYDAVLGIVYRLGASIVLYIVGIVDVVLSHGVWYACCLKYVVVGGVCVQCMDGYSVV